MKISVVSTLYRSARFLPEFLEQLLQALRQTGCDEYELIFVNDGSPDDSVAYLLSRQADIPQLVVADLSRNFGHHAALQAGMRLASGDLVFLIDNDLETPPAILVTFFREMMADPAPDVVYGYQDARKGKWIERVLGRLFWWLINKISDTRIPPNILTERLMRKAYVDELLQLQDANLFLGGMFYWVGFVQKGIPVAKGTREGQSTYSTARRIELMLQAVTSFSGKPLEWLFYFGILISLFSTVFIAQIVLRKLFSSEDIQLGWTSLIAVNFLILGVISTFLGIIGMYLFRVFKQVQGRPNAIIRKIYR